MPHNWQMAYGELKEYIAKHPTITIGMNVIRLDDDVRPEFYRLFGAVCTGFLKDNFPELLEKGHVLSRNWGEISRTMMDSLKLELIDVDPSTRWFLLDPNDGLTRGLFDTLFDLLKGKIDLAAFEQAASRGVTHEFARFYHQGYRYWVTLALLKLLSTDKVYHVPPSDYDSDPGSHTTLTDGSCEEIAPSAVEMDKISLEPSFMHSFMVPRIIGHSARLNLYTAFSPDFDYNVASWKVKNPDTELEWHEMAGIVREFGEDKLWPDMAIYLGTNHERLTVTADYWRMARPDVTLEFREDQEWYEREGLEPVRRHYNVLKPKLGSFVVCLEPVPEAALKELEDKPEMQRVDTGATHEAAQLEPQAVAGVAITGTPVQPSFDIHLLSVGYDLSKLEPIVETMLKVQTKSEEATIENTSVEKH